VFQSIHALINSPRKEKRGAFLSLHLFGMTKQSCWELNSVELHSTAPHQYAFVRRSLLADAEHADMSFRKRNLQYQPEESVSRAIRFLPHCKLSAYAHSMTSSLNTSA